MEPRSDPLVALDNEDKKYLMTLGVTELISNLRTALGLVDYDRVKEVLVEKESKLNAQIKELRIKNAKLEDEKCSAESEAEYWKSEYKELIQHLMVKNDVNLFMNGDAHVGIGGNAKKLSSRIGGNTHLGIPDKLINEKDSPNKVVLGALVNGCSASPITVIEIEDSDDDDYENCIRSGCSNIKKKAAHEIAATVDDRGHLILSDQSQQHPKRNTESFKRKWLQEIANQTDGCDTERRNNTHPRIPNKLIGEKDLNVVDMRNNNERGNAAARYSPSQQKDLRSRNTPNSAAADKFTRQSQDSPNEAFLGASANECSASRITVIQIEDSEDNDNCITSGCSNRKKESACEMAAAVDDNTHLILSDQSQQQLKINGESSKRKWLPEIANLMDGCDSESSPCDKRRRKT